MFSVLMGALAGIGVILYELNEPFQGPFRITPATGQLRTIRRALDEAICADE